jgi:hypothetical protein
MLLATPSLRNSAGGVGRVLIRRFNSLNNKWLRKNYLLNSMNYFLYFVSYLTSNAPKTLILLFPRLFRSSLLPFILPCIPDAYFWLFVVWKIVDRQPPKAKAPPKSLFLLLFHLVTPNDGMTPPNAFQLGRAFSSTSPLLRPPTVS